MMRALPAIAALLSAGVMAVAAQQATHEPKSPVRPPALLLIPVTVPPIAGAPLSATALVEYQQVMPDGSTALSRFVTRVARDSRGRTYGEVRWRTPLTHPGVGRLVQARIYDPKTSIRTLYYPGAHTAVRQIVPEQSPRANAPVPQGSVVKVEDLGSKTIDNLPVKGARRTTVIPAAASGTGAPVTVVDEYWYAEALHTNLLQVHTDPRTGTRTAMLADILRADPNPAFFKLPPGYHAANLIGFASSTGSTIGGDHMGPYSIPFILPGADVPGSITGAW